MKEKIQLKDIILAMPARLHKRIATLAGGGMLELYKTRNGAVAFYFRYAVKRRTVRVRIGLYDSSAPPSSVKPTRKGYSLTAAKHAATELAAKNKEAEGGLEAVMKEEKAIADAKKAELAAAGYSLEKMYMLYADSLVLPDTQRQAKSLFNKNIKLAFPELAEKQANKVTEEDVLEILRAIIESGYKRTAEKMHSYFRAAYEKAISAGKDVTISAEFNNYKIKHNPASQVKMSGKKRSDKNPLSDRDLRAYYRLLAESEAPEAAFLKLQLCLAGQRVAQLKRLKNKDIKRDLITLHDIKGRGSVVREINLPLLPAAAEALKKIRITDSDDAINISETALRRFVDEVVRKEIYDFEIKRVRSGVTTLLSKLKVSQEIRNLLQSHNQNTVDSEHYNAYDFYEEKKEALKKMHDFLASGDVD